MSNYKAVLYKLIGQRIREMRDDLKITQGELADQIDNISRASLSNAEKGRHQLSIHTLYSIAKIFNIEIYDLLPSNRQILEELSKGDVEMKKIEEILTHRKDLGEDIKKKILGI